MFFHSSVCQYIEAPFSFNLVCLCHLCLFLCVLLTYAFMVIYERVNAQCVQVCGAQRFTLDVSFNWFSHHFWRHRFFFPESAPHWFTNWWLPGQQAPETLLFPSPEHQEFRSKPCGASLEEDWVLLTEDSNHFLSPLSRLHGVISFVPTHAPWYNIQPHTRLKTILQTDHDWKLWK